MSNARFVDSYQEFTIRLNFHGETMQYSVVCVFLFVCFSLLTAAFAEEEIPLIVPPFMKDRGQLLADIPRGDRGQQGLQRLLNTDFHRRLDPYVGSYIKIIRDYRLGQELRLTRNQAQQLSKIRYDEPATMFAATDVPEDRKKLQAFVDQQVQRFALQFALTNAQVAEVLSDKQLLRVKQIRFQVHTLAHPNVKSALAVFDRKIDSGVAKNLSMELGQLRIKARALPNYLTRTYYLDAVRGVLGNELFRSLVGPPQGIADIYPAFLEEFLEPEEHHHQEKKDSPIATALLGEEVQANWLMRTRNLKARLQREADGLALTAEQRTKIHDIKTLPDRSVFEYSYVVAKTGVKEPDFNDKEKTRVTMAVAVAAKQEYQKRLDRQTVQLGNLLTAEQRARLKQEEIRNDCALGNGIRVLEFHGIPLSDDQKEELMVAYREVPERVLNRIFELHIAGARDSIAKHLQIEPDEVKELTGDAFIPVLRMYHDHDFLPRARMRRTQPQFERMRKERQRN